MGRTFSLTSLFLYCLLLSATGCGRIWSSVDTLTKNQAPVLTPAPTATPAPTPTATPAPQVFNAAWMTGSNVVNQSGVYGVKGTGSTSNTPGARQASTSWTDSSGNFWLFGGYGYDSVGTQDALNDLWKYTPLNGQWTWVAGSNVADQGGTYGTMGTGSTSNFPGARWGTVSLVDSQGNVWFFGGYGYDSTSSGGFLDDLWKFNPSNGQWTWVSGTNVVGQGATYGTQGMGSTSNIPEARYDFVGWMDSSDNFWLFGGYNSFTGGYFNDLWKFNSGNGQWTWVEGSNTKNQSGVYGTQGTGSTANIPGSGYSSAAWKDASGIFWLFGGNRYDGAGNQSAMNDLWSFNPANLEWTWVAGSNMEYPLGAYGTQGTPSTSNYLGGRLSPTWWLRSGGDIYFFGGEGFATTLNIGDLSDLWQYNPTSQASTWVAGPNTRNQLPTYGTQGTPNPLNIPGARTGALPFTDVSGNLWLFGGYGYDSAGTQGSLNDLWMLTR